MNLLKCLMFVTAALSPALAVAKVGTCREHIAKVTCYGDSFERGPNGEHPEWIPCRAQSTESAVARLIAIYDALPENLGRMFCGMRQIVISPDSGGSAMSEWLLDEQQHVVGARLWFKEAIFEAAPSLSYWASWKDQQSFGGIVDHMETTPGLPVIEASLPGVPDDFLYFVTVHEFGHFFDIHNHVNHDHTWPDAPEPIFDQDWMTFSWIDEFTVAPASDFLNRDRLCFYDCPNPMTAAEAPVTYARLMSSPFVSLYTAGSEPGNDFADSLAYAAINRLPGASYEVVLADGTRFDVLAKYRDSKAFVPKREYLETLLDATNLRYPSFDQGTGKMRSSKFLKSGI